MAKTKYSVEKIKSFLKKEYGFEWKGSKIYDFGDMRSIAYDDIHDGRLRVSAFLTDRNGKTTIEELEVTNDKFVLNDEDNEETNENWKTLLKVDASHLIKRAISKKDRNYSIYQINKFIEEIGLVWVDKLVYDNQKGTYHRATTKDFKQDEVYLYLKNAITDVAYTIRTEISEDKFQINREGLKMLASDLWKEYLQGKLEDNTNYTKPED